MKLAIILLFITALAIAADQYPPECNHYDCPSYTLLFNDEASSIQIRQYESTRWARTAIKGFYYQEAVSTGFNRLFNYISGGNSASASIAMTAPVAVQVIPGAGPFCESTFIVSFYVPSTYQAPNAAPPAPTDSDVFIETLPTTTKAIYMFPGYVTEWNQLVAPISDLVNYISSEGYEFIPNIETIAGYDSPFHLVDRHNEIWIDVLGYN